jgi:hypothetical protein
MVETDIPLSNRDVGRKTNQSDSTREKYREICHADHIHPMPLSIQNVKRKNCNH